MRRRPIAPTGNFALLSRYLPLAKPERFTSVLEPGRIFGRLARSPEVAVGLTTAAEKRTYTYASRRKRKRRKSGFGRDGR
jgi:hypothetical protein